MGDTCELFSGSVSTLDLGTSSVSADTFPCPQILSADGPPNFAQTTWNLWFGYPISNEQHVNSPGSKPPNHHSMALQATRMSRQAEAAFVPGINGSLTDGPHNETNSNPSERSEPPENASITAFQTRTKSAWNCLYKECSHLGTFRRRYELNRHIRVRHEGGKSFSCPYRGCFKGRHAPSFARPDKLTAHIRAVHHRQAGQSLICPAENCVAPPLELDLLGMHIKKRHLGIAYSLESLRALANAASPEYWHCPLWNCGVAIRLPSVLTHLLGHSPGELESIADELLSVNYVLVRGSTPVFATPEWAGQHLDSTRIAGVRVLCPVCALECDDHAAFESHIDEVHLVHRNKQRHFRSWRDYAREHNIWRKGETLKPWTKWEPRRAWKRIQCPSCDFYQPVLRIDRYYRYKKVVDHHIGMLADPEEIKPYRRDILKLYPDFATHPIWNDMA